jgi:amino acid transporter
MACIALFSSLDVLTSLLSISTLFIFMMMATALIVRRYYQRGVSTKPHFLKLVAFLLMIIASSIGTSAYWGLRPQGWVDYVVTVPTWFASTLGIQLFLPQCRTPKLLQGVSIIDPTRRVNPIWHDLKINWSNMRLIFFTWIRLGRIHVNPTRPY